MALVATTLLMCLAVPLGVASAVDEPPVQQIGARILARQAFDGGGAMLDSFHPRAEPIEWAGLDGSEWDAQREVVLTISYAGRAPDEISVVLEPDEFADDLVVQVLAANEPGTPHSGYRIAVAIEREPLANRHLSLLLDDGLRQPLASGYTEIFPLPPPPGTPVADAHLVGWRDYRPGRTDGDGNVLEFEVPPIAVVHAPADVEGRLEELDAPPGVTGTTHVLVEFVTTRADSCVWIDFRGIRRDGVTLHIDAPPDRRALLDTNQICLAAESQELFTLAVPRDALPIGSYRVAYAGEVATVELLPATGSSSARALTSGLLALLLGVTLLRRTNAIRSAGRAGC